MRFFYLFVFLIPAVLYSQEPPTVGSNNFPGKNRKFRFGIEYLYDSTPDQPYIERFSRSTPVLKRDWVHNYLIDYAPFPRSPYLRLQLQVGKHRSQFADSLATSLIFFPREGEGPAISEKLTYERLQLGVGLQLTPFYRSTFAPYLSAHYLLSIPQYLDYEMTHKNDYIPLPGYRSISGGGKNSPGWKMALGCRVLIASHFSFRLGVYYIQQEVRADWSAMLYRDFRGVAMRLQNTGASFGAQLCF